MTLTFDPDRREGTADAPLSDARAASNRADGDPERQNRLHRLGFASGTRSIVGLLISRSTSRSAAALKPFRAAL